MAWAAPGASAAAKRGIEKYKQGEYDAALQSLQFAATQADELSELQRAQVHTYIAFCEVAYSRREAAKQNFRIALELNPNLNLEDPDIPPKIREVFREVKSELAGSSSSHEVRPAFTGTVPAHQRLKPIDATWRSALLPGWGQFATNRPAMGATMTGAALASGGALVYTQLNASKAKRYYDSAPAGLKVDQYEQLVRFNRYRNIALGTTVAVWTAAMLDAYFGHKRLLETSGVQITPVATDNAYGVGITARF